MAYVDLIREARPKMSKSFVRLADFILDSYIQAALMTATELAHEVDVDAATVVRFAQSLGYTGFPKLQNEIKERVRNELLLRPAQAADRNTLPGIVDATLQRLSQSIEQTRRLLDANAVEDLVARIGSARRIIVLPESPARGAAYNLVNLLEQGGFIVTTAQNGVNDLARIVSTSTSQDLLLAIDVAGQAPFIGRALSEAAQRGIQTATIAGAASLQSAQQADVVLAAQSQPDLGTGVVVVDAVVYTLAETLRWQFPERFEGANEAIEAMYARIQVGS